MTTNNMIKWEQDNDGIVILTMDDPNQSVNTMNETYLQSMEETIEKLEAEKDNIKGVILTSSKKTFFAGGDLNLISKATKQDTQRLVDYVRKIKNQLRRLEQLGKPVVAAINGSALGGGLEIALATHHRIAANTKGSQIGLPEVSLGLLPGGGGVTRTVRLLGLQTALLSVLLQGQRMRPEKAKAVGLIDELVNSVADLIPAAKNWINTNPEAVQPWDKEGYKIPGGKPTSPAIAANLPAFPANLRKQIKGANMPAPKELMAAAVEGALVDFDSAAEIETRYFVHLATGQVSKNMTNAFFFNLQHINSGGSRPTGYPKYTAKKLAVIGAGMMGAAIAYVSAKAGIEVVLKDISLEAAQKGKNYSEKLEEKALSRGRTTPEKSKALLDKITPTDKYEDLAGADIVIEAVFESVELKQKVFSDLEKIVAPDAILGSNTSTLPITILADGVERKTDFIGIHFFSPVDKMPLVEIIRGKETSDATLAKVIDYTLQIKKTPIVVNDHRGFFTSRVIATFIGEAIAAVGEGVEPQRIEQAGLQAGYPAAPLQLTDELTLTLSQKIRKETVKAFAEQGIQLPSHGSEWVIDKMVDELGRKGRSTGGGFYDYDENGKRTGLWSGLRKEFNSGSHDISLKDLADRMLFIEALETVRCFDEGVLNSVADANIGSIFGIGFPAWTGGVIQFINQYEGGLAGFIARAKELAAKYGDQFLPPDSLIAKAEAGEIYS